MVKNNDLHKRLKTLGFQLFEAEGEEDANLALADVVKSHDLRLWEGFPVMLANSAEHKKFDYNKVVHYFKKPVDKANFNALLAMSLALYKAMGKHFSWSGSVYEKLNSEQRKECNKLVSVFKKEGDFRVGGHTMSAERAKEAFSNYYNQNNSTLNEVLMAKEELGLEYALSQVFSPKQKDLFLKKLKGEKFTKTEKEYYSRTVKKKVVALASPELHRLSQKLL